MSHYDDNFGHWEMNGPEDYEFYHRVQRTNVEKQCDRCGRTVRIQPHYAICNSCADAAERGFDY